jgi:hypothetical protein
MRSCWTKEMTSVQDNLDTGHGLDQVFTRVIYVIILCNRTNIGVVL